MASTFVFADLVEEVKTVLIGENLELLEKAYAKENQKDIQEKAEDVKQQLKERFNRLSDRGKKMLQTLIKEGKPKEPKTKQDQKAIPAKQENSQSGKTANGNNHESGIDIAKSPKPSSASPKSSRASQKSTSALSNPPEKKTAKTSSKKPPTEKKDVTDPSKTLASTPSDNQLQDPCKCKTTSMASTSVLADLVDEVKTVLIGKKLELLEKAYTKENQKDIQEKAKDMKHHLKERGLHLSEPGKKMLETLIKEGKPAEPKTKQDQKAIPAKQENSQSGKTANGNNHESGIDIAKSSRLSPKPSSASPKSSRASQKSTSVLFNPPEKKPEKTSSKKPQTEKKDVTDLSKTIGSTPSDNQLHDPHTLHVNMLKEKVQNQEKAIKDLESSLKEAKEAKERLEKESKENTEISMRLERTANEYYDTNSKLKDDNETLRAQNTNLIEKVKELKVAEQHEKEKSKEYKAKYEDIRKEHDDLKSRYSKVAASKLQDGNPNLTDLSDPNRPTKLSERFSQLYDDSWTDAFQAQITKLKREPKDVIQHLLKVLEECYTFCEQTAQQQMDGIRNLMLHPCQDTDQLVVANLAAKGLNRPRIASKEENELKVLRKKIGIQTTADIRQKFVTYMQKKTTGDKSALERMAESMTFYKESADICWHMVLNDPPVYMKMEVKPGDKIDLSLYTKYSASGIEIDYLVWPPLGIKGGGFLSKGVIEPKPTK